MANKEQLFLATKLASSGTFEWVMWNRGICNGRPMSSACLWTTWRNAPVSEAHRSNTVANCVDPSFLYTFMVPSREYFNYELGMGMRRHKTRGKKVLQIVMKSRWGTWVKNEKHYMKILYYDTIWKISFIGCSFNAPLILQNTCTVHFLTCLCL